MNANVEQSDANSRYAPFPIYKEPTAQEPCCGPPVGPPSSPHERPGYQLLPLVVEFLPTAVGDVPCVRTTLNRQDQLGALRVRLGIGRDSYKIAPGLYAAGRPSETSPVVVTANYKLSFDHLRCHLDGVDTWILVLDTRGINVWCAAGKGTFGATELVQRVQQTGLSRLVSHRRLILPQLGAAGVAAQQVKKGCGFEVVWGPIQAQDVKAFLAAGLKAEVAMRRVTFSLAERVVLIPVELALLRKYLLWAIAAMVVISGIGPSVFSFSAAWHRGWLAAAGCVAGVLAGCVVVPLLLGKIPGRAFSVKGSLAGLVLGFIAVAALAVNPYLSFWNAAAMVGMSTGVGSFLAMNFTGSTPFTSASGVEKEMRRAIPAQIAIGIVSIALWIGAAFVN